jgi:hypothetical protein
MRSLSHWNHNTTPNVAVASIMCSGHTFRVWTSASSALGNIRGRGDTQKVLKGRFRFKLADSTQTATVVTMFTMQATARKEMLLEGRVTTSAWTQRQKSYAKFILAGPRKVTTSFIGCHKVVGKGSLNATGDKIDLAINPPKKHFWNHDSHIVGVLKPRHKASHWQALIVEVAVVIVPYQGIGTNDVTGARA